MRHLLGRIPTAPAELDTLGFSVNADPFESSRRKLARAKEHIANLDHGFRAFVQQNPYTVVIEPNAESADYLLHKLKLTAPFPASLGTIAGDAVNNLRESLDHLAYNMAVRAGVARPDHIHFPFAREGAADFDVAVKGRCKGLPEDIVAVFRSFEPYKGGNALLWTLNEACNRNKHRLITDLVGVASRGRTYIIATNGFASVPETLEWDGVNHEVVIAETGPGTQFKYDFHIACDIAFDDIEPVRGQPAVALLNRMAGEVERVLMATETEARRIGLI